jgi:hypothetical protein
MTTQSPAASVMTGTPSQIEWAAQIKPRVNAEFDRVADAFRHVAGKQADQDRIETLAVIALLEEKRTEVMRNDSAGYFIRDWRELGDQVRRLIADDPRYHDIQAARESRRKTSHEPSANAIS